MKRILFTKQYGDDSSGLFVMMFDDGTATCCNYTDLREMSEDETKAEAAWFLKQLKEAKEQYDANE